jgi:hypothetical protein
MCYIFSAVGLHLTKFMLTSNLQVIRQRLQHPLTRSSSRRYRARIRDDFDSSLACAFAPANIGDEIHYFRIPYHLGSSLNATVYLLFRHWTTFPTVAYTFCFLRFFRDYPLSGGSVLSVSMFMLL